MLEGSKEDSGGRGVKEFALCSLYTSEKLIDRLGERCVLVYKTYLKWSYSNYWKGIVLIGKIVGTETCEACIGNN